MKFVQNYSQFKPPNVGKGLLKARYFRQLDGPPTDVFTWDRSGRLGRQEVKIDH